MMSLGKVIQANYRTVDSPAIQVENNDKNQCSIVEKVLNDPSSQEAKNYFANGGDLISCAEFFSERMNQISQSAKQNSNIPYLRISLASERVTLIANMNSCIKLRKEYESSFKGILEFIIAIFKRLLCFSHAPLTSESKTAESLIKKATQETQEVRGTRTELSKEEMHQRDNGILLIFKNSDLRNDVLYKHILCCLEQSPLVLQIDLTNTSLTESQFEDVKSRFTDYLSGIKYDLTTQGHFLKAKLLK